MNKKQSPPRPLTSKERNVLMFIEDFLQSHEGLAPSFQEIRDHFGFASLNSVQRYLKQLQSKEYIHIPSGNQKRAITLLQASNTVTNLLSQLPQPGHGLKTTQNPFLSNLQQRGASPLEIPVAESLYVPLLGKVAAGQPIEANEHNEFIQAPSHLLKDPGQSYALTVQGQSMIDDGIMDGDILLIQSKNRASNGETIIAMIENESTVKRFYLHPKLKKDSVIHTYPQLDAQLESSSSPWVELRPANSSMKSMWYPPDQVRIQGVVVGLIRKY